MPDNLSTLKHHLAILDFIFWSMLTIVGHFVLWATGGHKDSSMINELWWLGDGCWTGSCTCAEVKMRPSEEIRQGIAPGATNWQKSRAKKTLAGALLFWWKIMIKWQQTLNMPLISILIEKRKEKTTCLSLIIISMIKKEYWLMFSISKTCGD